MCSRSLPGSLCQGLKQLRLWREQQRRSCDTHLVQRGDVGHESELSFRRRWGVTVRRAARRCRVWIRLPSTATAPCTCTVLPSANPRWSLRWSFGELSRVGMGRRREGGLTFSNALHSTPHTTFHPPHHPLSTGHRRHPGSGVSSELTHLILNQRPGAGGEQRTTS